MSDLPERLSSHNQNQNRSETSNKIECIYFFSIISCQSFEMIHDDLGLLFKTSLINDSMLVKTEQ